MTMGIEIGMTEGTRDSVTGVVDRFDELRDDMESGFSKLRKNVEEMGADELRRDVQNLMMIGNSQMDTIRRQRREIEGMQQDLMRRHGERTKVVAASMDLLRTMGVPFDPEDDSPAKWLLMAATVAEKAEEAEEKMARLDRRLTQSQRDVDRLAAENEAYSRIVREFPRLSACMLVVAIVEAVALCLALIS